MVWDADDFSNGPTLSDVVGQGAFTEAAPVPETSSLALLALGAGGLAYRRKRRVA
ncbi:MAG: PEP-CTERM sorting domain-containing protein [Verrucomicrobiales bacterium]